MKASSDFPLSSKGPFCSELKGTSPGKCVLISLSVSALPICYPDASLTFSFPLHHTLTHPAYTCVLHHLGKLMANFIIWERKMQMKPDSWCSPRAEHGGGAGPSSETPTPSCSDRPWRGWAERLLEQREQMARRGRDRAAQCAGESGEGGVSVAWAVRGSPRDRGGAYGAGRDPRDRGGAHGVGRGPWGRAVGPGILKHLLSHRGTES